MNLTQLQYFDVLAKNQHYSRTAEELSIAQSSLSRSVSQLEEELGTCLFEKKGRNVVLTKYGELFYRHVHAGLTEINTGVQSVKELMDPKKGMIDLAFIYALSSGYVPKIIQAFSSQPENSGYQFHFYQGNTPSIIDLIKEGTCDLGICSYFNDEPLIEFTPVTVSELRIAVSKHHPLARRSAVSLQEAAEYDMIFSLDKTNFLEQLFREKGISPKVISRMQEDHAIASLVSINYGISVLPYDETLLSHDIRLIPVAPEPLFRKFYLAVQKNHYLSPAAKAFYRFVREAF